MAHEEFDQLYTLVHHLSLLVVNRDEFGSIVGHAVVSGLLSFSTQAGTLKEIQYEEVVAVHTELEQTVAACRLADSFRTLCDLTVKVHDFLKTELPDDNLLQSPLLKRIVSHLNHKRGVSGDILRRCGINLANALFDQGALTRRIDCLEQDYRLLDACFTT